MPFKFRLRRARRYNVSSKNSYVVCVHLLDKTLIECTLSADSLGQECMENIAQRSELGQTAFFGLRYVNKKLQYRWVELDKPLKKQLDKYAHSPLLYFGVMFYVANTACITDDNARYQYYLQLKTDVIDGKLPCKEDQAIRLASYSVQAEFGDHDRARHTPEFFKDFVLLPRSMTTDDAVLQRLIQSMVTAHPLLVGCSSVAAELQYIMEAQQIQGYGLEYYPAKDESENELLLGSSFVGIFVKPMNNSQPTQYFKWSDINNLIHNKRVFGIETSLTERTVQYIMETPDMAKYTYKMCSLQRDFYRTNKHTVETESDGSVPLEEGSVGPMPDLQQTVQLAMEQERSKPSSSTQSPVQAVSDVGQTILPAEEYVGSPPGTVDLQPDIQYTNGHINHIAPSQQQQQQQQLQHQQQMQAQQQQIQLQQQQLQQQQQQLQQQQQQTLQPQPQQQTVSSYQPAVVGPKPILPAYRPSPDYESVMRRRMERMTQQNLEQINNVANISHAQVYAHPETMAYSQPEMGGYTQQFVGHQPVRPYSHSVYGNAMVDGVHHVPSLQCRPVDRSSSLVIHPTYSTPELNTQGLTSQFSTSENLMNEALLVNHYKPPPPYPRPSSSTPDLASQTMRAYVSSSPDLVSRKNISNAALVEQSRLDQSLENLAMDTQRLQVSHHQVALQQQQQQQQHVNESELLLQQQRHTPIMDRLLSSHQQQMDVFDQTTGENIYVNTAGSGDYANVSAIIASESGSNQHYIHFSEQHFENGGNLHLLQQQQQQNALQQQQNPMQFQEQPQRSPVMPPHHHTPHQVALGDQSILLNLTGLDNPSFSSAGGDTTNNSEVMDCLDTSRQSAVTPHHRHSSSLDSSISQDSRMFPQDSDTDEDKANKRLSMGPLKMAALNGLSISRASVLEPSPGESRAPKDERRKTLEAKLEEGQVFVEFEQIPRKAAKYDCSVAAGVDNRDRNRFKDVHPYDHNRVKLAASKDNPGGYINASHVKMTVKGDTWRYIAAQGPLAGTVRDFWAMVWEQGVEVVAMLTGVVEHGRQKCHPYWPDKQGPKNKVKHGDWEVMLQFSTDSGCYHTRGLKLRHVPTKKERLVWHLQYTDWPDHGCPEDIHGFLAYLDEIESVQRHIASEKGDAPAGPVLVHCSAGVGRSGVVILAEIMKTCLEHNVNVDVPTVLGHLRAQRMYLVQTMSQYSFVYKTLVQFLNNSRLI